MEVFYYLLPHADKRPMILAGNDLDVTRLDLGSILPGPTVMVVTVSASNSHGQVLTGEEMAYVEEACSMAFALNEALDKILKVCFGPEAAVPRALFT